MSSAARFMKLLIRLSRTLASTMLESWGGTFLPHISITKVSPKKSTSYYSNLSVEKKLTGMYKIRKATESATVHICVNIIHV